MDASTKLPALTVRINDHRAVFRERVGHRKLIYLDHNFWIELRDRRTDETVACENACRAAVARQQALFPLAFPAITEAIEIADLPLRLRHAELLDDLSLGVTFRAPPKLLALEAQYAMRWLITDEDSRLERSEVLTSMPDYLGDSVVKFPEGWTVENVARFMSEVARNPKTRSVRFIAEHRQWGIEHLPMRERYVREMAAVQKLRAGDERLAKQMALSRALLRERISLFKGYVLPAARIVLAEEFGEDGVALGLKSLESRKGEGGKRRLEQLFRRMPMLDQLARMHALDALEVNRRPRSQDFYDIEHGSVPPIYADAFVTLDRRLAQLVKGAGRASATILTGLKEVTDWLAQNCPS